MSKNNRPFFPAYQGHNPTRPPDWRWRRALDLVNKGRNFSRLRDDNLTAQAVRYVRDLRLWGVEHASRLESAHPPVHAAHRLHHEHPWLAVEVQARLLARQSIEETARSTSLPVAMVSTYEGLFFNVIGHLDAKDWVTAHAVGWWDFDPSEGRHPSVVLRAFAYHGGLVVLEAMLPYVVGSRSQHHQPGVYKGNQAGLGELIRHVLDAETAPHDQKSLVTLLEARASYLEALQKVSTVAPNEGNVAGHVQKIVEDLAEDALRRTPRSAAGTVEGQKDAVVLHTA